MTPGIRIRDLAPALGLTIAALAEQVSDACERGARDASDDDRDAIDARELALLDHSRVRVGDRHIAVWTTQAATRACVAFGVRAPREWTATREAVTA